MSNSMVQLQEATIKAQCKTLRMPMVAAQFGTLAEQAISREAEPYRISRSPTAAGDRRAGTQYR